MIKLLLFAILYLGDFSYINSLQFTGRGFCASTGGGVFVYDIGKGIVVSYIAENPYLAAYDPASGEVVYVDAHNVLYLYSGFFGILKTIGRVAPLKGLGVQNGIIMLEYKNGARRYISKYNQPAPRIYIDSMKVAREREIPMYLRTRNYNNMCYAFYRSTSFARGYNYDYVGTNGTGVFIFDRTMKKKLRGVFLNIEPPVYHLTRVFDTVYVLHHNGITKISKGYVSSLTPDCFQNGFYPVDMLFSENGAYIVNRHGYYTATEPFFFTPFEKQCGDGLKVLYDDKGGIVVLSHCLLKITDKGSPVKVLQIATNEIEDAGILDNRTYLILGGQLVFVDDTSYKNVIFNGEPVIASRIIQGLYRVYIAAKRGLFIIENGKIRLEKTPFNMLDVRDGVEDEDNLYLALKSQVISFNIVDGEWKSVIFDNIDLRGITSITSLNNRLYVGTDRGVVVK